MNRSQSVPVASTRCLRHPSRKSAVGDHRRARRSPRLEMESRARGSQSRKSAVPHTGASFAENFFDAVCTLNRDFSLEEVNVADAALRPALPVSRSPRLSLMSGVGESIGYAAHAETTTATECSREAFATISAETSNACGVSDRGTRISLLVVMAPCFRNRKGK